MAAGRTIFVIHTPRRGPGGVEVGGGSGRSRRDRHAAAAWSSSAASALEGAGEAEGGEGGGPRVASSVLGPAGLGQAHRKAWLAMVAAAAVLCLPAEFSGPATCDRRRNRGASDAVKASATRRELTFAARKLARRPVAASQGHGCPSRVEGTWLGGNNRH